MGTIIIGSSTNRKGVTVNPSEVFFNGNVVKAIMSGVAEIWSSATALVPAMTSNTTPYGEAFASSEYSADYSAYKAFDGVDTSRWTTTNNTTTATIQYKFANPTRVSAIGMRVLASGQASSDMAVDSSFKVQYSNDGTNWSDIETISTSANDASVLKKYSINNSNYALYIRIAFLSKNIYNTSYSYNSLASLQFYGTQLVGLVPTMTSNTTPYGEAFASSEYNNDYPAWKAFDGVTIHSWLPVVGSGKEDFVGYKFPKPIRAKLMYINYSTENQVFDQAQPYVKVQASDNNSDWIDVSSSVALNKDAKNVSGHLMLEISATKEYTHYRALFSPTICVTGNTSDFMTINTLQFYGDKPLFEPLIPVMTSNTTPSGVASASDNISGFDAYMAFDNNATTRWASNNTKDAYIIYQFESGKTVNSINIKQEYADSNAPSSGTIYVYGKSANDSDYIQIGSVPFSVNNFDIMLSLTEKVCKSVKIRVVANNGKYATITSCQLYK